MTLEYNISVEDIKAGFAQYYDTSKIVKKQKQKIHIMYSTIIIVYVLIFLATNSLLSGTSIIWLGICVALYSFFISYHKKHFIKTSIKVLTEKDKDYFGGLNTLTITNEGIIEKTKFGLTQFNWQGNIELFQTQNLLILLLKENTMIIVVNKEKIINGKFEEFVTTLKDKYELNKSNSKEQS